MVIRCGAGAGGQRREEEGMDQLTSTSLIVSVLAAVGASLLTTISTIIVNDRRMGREFRLHFQAETIVRKLLQHPRWRLRTFDTIKYHIGGFKDDDLRKILVQAGALRFHDRSGVEVWGLIERNKDRLAKEHGTARN